MKKIFSLVALLMIVVTSCQVKQTEKEVITITTGAYILNQGNYGSNDASLSHFDMSNGKLIKNLFSGTNNQALGDCAQDMIGVGQCIVISVYNSKVIYIVNSVGKLLYDPISFTNRSPRYLAYDNDYIYVSFYEGYLGRISRSTAKYVDEVQVGRNPEQIAVSDGKIYVANSGGLDYPDYDSTVSVVDAKTFKVTATIDVVTNPTDMTIDGDGDLYLISKGDYGAVPNTLQRINTRTDKVENTFDFVATAMSIGKDGIMYILSSQYDASWNAVTKFYKFDTKTEKLIGEFVLQTPVENPYSIYCTKVNDYIFIGSSDYVSEGSISIYNSEGKQLTSFKSGGINPFKCLFTSSSFVVDKEVE